MLEQLDKLEREGLEELARADGAEALERWRIEFIGPKGKVKAAFGLLKDVPKNKKKAFGQRSNALKKTLDKAARRRIIHPRNAARRKSRLMKHLNALQNQA